MKNRFGASPNSILEGFGGILGASWALLGTLGRLLGASWALLGRLLGALRCLLGACWVPHAALDSSRLDFGGVWSGSGEGFEGSRAIIFDVLLLLAHLW